MSGAADIKHFGRFVWRRSDSLNYVTPDGVFAHYIRAEFDFVLAAGDVYRLRIYSNLRRAVVNTGPRGQWWDAQNLAAQAMFAEHWGAQLAQEVAELVMEVCDHPEQWQQDLVLR